MKSILKQIDLADVFAAVQRAEKIRGKSVADDRCIINRSCIIAGENNICYANPDLSIHKHVKSILAQCLNR